INIRNFIGTTSLRTSRPLSATSMSPRVGVGGLQASTATYFVPSVSYAIRGHSPSVVSDALLPPPDEVIDPNPAVQRSFGWQRRRGRRGSHGLRYACCPKFRFIRGIPIQSA